MVVSASFFTPVEAAQAKRHSGQNTHEVILSPVFVLVHLVLFRVPLDSSCESADKQMAGLGLLDSEGKPHPPRLQHGYELKTMGA